jgi:hypothetical protein
MDSVLATIVAPRNDSVPLTSVKASQAHQLICPSCQCVAGFFACDDGQITGTFPRVFCPHEGRFAIVTKRGAGDAVDAAAQTTNARVADGEVVAS